MDAHPSSFHDDFVIDALELRHLPCRILVFAGAKRLRRH